MKKNVLSGLCFISLTLLAGACGSSHSENSTASGLRDLFDPPSDCAIKPVLEAGQGAERGWRTLVRDEPVAAELGEPENYGVEVSEEIKKAGWFAGGDAGVVRRRTCSRAYRLEANRKVYLEPNKVPGSLQIASVRAEANYLLMSGQVGEKAAKQSVIVYLNLANGERQVIATEPVPEEGCQAFLSTKASPEGQHILIERLEAEACGVDEGRYNVTITILDAKAQVLGAPITENLTGGSQYRWLSETSYQLQDNERTLNFTVPVL